MITLNGRSSIPDHMLHSRITKEEMERKIEHDLAHSFSKLLVESKDFQAMEVMREHADPFNPFGETIYEARMVLLTENEAKEYQELKKFRHQMQNFVHHPHSW